MRHIRNIAKTFDATYQTTFSNLLVSGCSFTYNNSDQHACSWPYYLKDLCGFKEVYDCSQSGAGQNHILYSIVNEIETTDDITPENTFVIIEWSGFTRVDVIADSEITKDIHFMSNYKYNKRFATLSISEDEPGEKTDIGSLNKMYRKLVDPDAQIYQGCLNICLMKNYLESKGFNYVFTSMMDPRPELQRVKNILVQETEKLLSNLEFLHEFSVSTHRVESCGHPTPDCYLDWTRSHLIPYLENVYPAFFQKI